MHASFLLTSTSIQSLLYNWSLQSSTYCLSVSNTLATTTNLRQFRSVSLLTYSSAEICISCFVPKNGNYFNVLICNRIFNNFKSDTCKHSETADILPPADYYIAGVYYIGRGAIPLTCKAHSHMNKILDCTRSHLFIMQKWIVPCPLVHDHALYSMNEIFIHFSLYSTCKILIKFSTKI